MKKYVVTTVLFILFAFLTAAPPPVPTAFDPAVVSCVLDHSLAVVSYFEAPQDQIDKIIARLRSVNISSRGLSPNWPLVIQVREQEKKAVAVIGAATLIKNNYALSVAHLFQVTDEDGKPLPLLRVWVIQRNTGHPILATVVAQTAFGSAFYDDYAVLKLSESLDLPGITIAKASMPQGSPVMFCGSVGGAAFFARFGVLTQFHRFFRRDDVGLLHVSQWTTFPLMCLFPGGGGDSGGGVFNAAGQLVGIIYCGLTLGGESRGGSVVGGETYVFSNPLENLLVFLRNNGLDGVSTQ